MAEQTKLPSAERAVALVREVMEREGAYAAEVTALGVCVAVVERLPRLLQTRVVNHLHKMFEGYDSLAILTAIVADAYKEKERADAAEKRIALLQEHLDDATRRNARLRSDYGVGPVPPTPGARD